MSVVSSVSLPGFYDVSPGITQIHRRSTCHICSHSHTTDYIQEFLGIYVILWVGIISAADSIVPSVISKFLLLHKMLWRQVPIFQIYTHLYSLWRRVPSYIISLIWSEPLYLPGLAPEVEIISQHTLLHVSSSSNLTPGHTSRVHSSSASVIVSHVSLSLLWLLIVCHTALQGVSCEEALLLQGDPVWEQEHDFRDWSSPISWGQIRISWN